MGAVLPISLSSSLFSLQQNDDEGKEGSQGERGTEVEGRGEGRASKNNERLSTGKTRPAAAAAAAAAQAQAKTD